MKCKHGPCKCQVSSAQSDGYCSQSCRQQKTNNGKCDCGHAGCR